MTTYGRFCTDCGGVRLGYQPDPFGGGEPLFRVCVHCDQIGEGGGMEAPCPPLTQLMLDGLIEQSRRAARRL